MTELPANAQPSTAERLVDGQGHAWSELQMLYEVMKALQSIRGTLQFFAVLVILGILVQACNVILTAGR